MTESSNQTGRFRVGIVGAGGISERHALAYESLPALARMVAVADVDASRAEAIRKLYRMDAAYADHRELLARDDVDVVSVCTRPNLHARLVIDAIEAGKHVLCEKPLAHTLADADEIIAASDRRPDVHVSCLYQWRTDPAMRWLKRRIEDGTLGRVLTAHVEVRTWRPPRYYEADPSRESWRVDGGGVLIVIAIHQLDSLVDLIGDAAATSAFMETHQAPSEGEDTLVGTIRFENDALATVSATVSAHENYFSIELVCENATVRLTGGGLTNNFSWELHAGRNERARRPWELKAPSTPLEDELRKSAREAVPTHRLEPGPLSAAALRKWNRMRGRPWVPPAHWWHTPYVRHFLEALAAGGPVPIPPREARRSLELTVAMYQAALSGEVVSLPLGRDVPIYAGVELPEVAAPVGQVGTA